MSLASNLTSLAGRISASAVSGGLDVSTSFVLGPGIIPYDPLRLWQWCQKEQLSTSAFLGRANSYRTTVGKEPGRGYFLVSKQQLDLLSEPFNLQIRELTAGKIVAKVVTIQDLYIDRAEAVHPSYDPSTLDKSKVSPASLYLLTVFDKRSEATDFVVTKTYNLQLNDHDSLPADISFLKAGAPWTVKQILNDLADSLGWTLSYLDPDLEILSDEPEGFHFPCMPAYEAFCCVLRAYSLQLALANNGTFWVIPPDLAGNTQVLTAIGSIQKRIVDHKGFNETPEPPAKVKVCFPNRDFQMQNTWSNPPEEAIVYAPEELMTAYPVWEHEWTNPGSGTGTHRIWAPRFHLTDSAGGNNETELEELADKLAENYVKQINQWHDWRQFTYVGVVDYEPLGDFNGVAWYDFGRGMHTKLLLQPPDRTWHLSLREFSGEDWIEQLQEETGKLDPFPTVPDVIRKHPVSPRIMFGAVGSQDIQVGEAGDCSLYSGSIMGNSVNWQPGIQIQAVAFFETLTAGSRVVLVYNWQLGAGGEWVAIGLKAGSQQQTLAIYALATTNDEYFSNTDTVPITITNYISPDPFSQPWVPTPTHAKNRFGHAGVSGQTVLLLYDKSNPTQPILLKSPWVEDEVGEELQYVSNDCKLNLNTRKILVPNMNDPSGTESTVGLTEVRVVADENPRQAISWDSNTCSIRYNRRDICAFTKTWTGTPGSEEIAVVDIRTIRRLCFPIRDCCPCPPCADVNTVTMWLTPANQNIGDPIVAPFTNCAEAFNQSYSLTRFVGNPPDPCGTDLGGICEEYWHFLLDGGNCTGSPSGWNFYLCCDQINDPVFGTPAATWSLCWSPITAPPQVDSPIWIKEHQECGCIIFSTNLQLGLPGAPNFCGCPDDPLLEIWAWFKVDSDIPGDLAPCTAAVLP